MIVIPVRLPPGRLRLATRPHWTGSMSVKKTIGMVVVAVFAASVAATTPFENITLTLRRTNSAARWLLRARREWPRRSAAKPRDELAPSHPSLPEQCLALTEPPNWIVENGLFKPPSTRNG